MSIEKTILRKATISSLESFDKKELTILISSAKILKPGAKDINIAIIGGNAYYIACHLKRA